MAFKHQDELKNSPYFDDFDDTKNFLQILFKPGVAVQARELTQLQSILQNQISKISDHIFKDGSQVFGAKVTLTNYFYIRIKNNSIKDATNTVINSDFTDKTVCENYFKNKQFAPTSFTYNSTSYTQRTGTSGIVNIEDDVDFQVKIIDVLPETVSDNLIIVFKFIKGNLNNLKQLTNIKLIEITNSNWNSTTVDALEVKDNSNQNPINFEVEPSVTLASELLLDNMNTVMVASVSPGIFYKFGRFVNTEESTTVLYKISTSSNALLEIESTMNNGLKTPITGKEEYVGRKLFSYPSKRIGFDITTKIVDFREDITLVDNAIGSYNEKAPGADRLKIDFTLTNKDFDIDVLENYNAESFVEVARVSKGAPDFIKGGADYSEILKLFAQRTYEESGSYTVLPFLIDFKEHLRKDLYIFSSASIAPQIEVGDLIVQSTIGANDVSIRFSGSTASTPILLFPTQTKPAGNYKYGTEIQSEPIGIIERIDRLGGKVYIRSLNGLSFSSFSSGKEFSVKTVDTGTFSQTVTLDASVQFILDDIGIYPPSNTTEPGDESKFVIKVNPGKAYIEGFSYENLIPQNVTCDKARDTFLNSSVINSQINNLIYMKPVVDSTLNNTLIAEDIFEEKIKVHGNVVEIEFRGTPESSFAQGQLTHWAPFKDGTMVNTQTPYININNKEHIAFVSGTIS